MVSDMIGGTPDTGVLAQAALWQTTVTNPGPIYENPGTMVNGKLLARPPQAHIKRALAAMADMGIVEADDKRAEFRQGQP